MAGIFDEYFEQKRREDAAQTAARIRLDPLKPEQAAEGVATAKELGVPPGQVMAFQSHFSDLLAQKRATTALTDAPKLSDWLRSDPVNGALAKDDLENLSWWERTFKPGLDLFGSAVGGSVTDSQVGLGLRTGITGAMQMAVSAATVPLVGQQATMLDRLDAYERAAQLDPGLARHEIASALGIDPMSQTAALVADFAMGDADRRQKHIDRTVRMITSNKELMSALVERVRAYEDHMKTTQGRVVNFTDIDDVSGFFDWMGFNVGQAAPYLAATLTASMAAGPVGAIGVGYSMGVGDIQSENLTSGRDPFATDAAGAAVVGAIPYAGLELLGPATAPFRGVSGEVLEGVASGYFRRLAREVPRNMVEEFINEAGQEIIKDYAVQIGGGADVVLDNETLLKWFNAGMAGAAAGGAMSAGQVSVSAATEAELRAVEEAGQTAALLDEVSRQAQASQVRARSPERFKAALDAAGMGDQMVYVPAQGLREFFQARDVPLDAATAEAWGFDLDSFAEMEIAGGQVAVPLSNFSANLVGTDAESWVRENATMDPDELSLTDAQAANAQVQDILDAEFEAMQAEWQAEEESRASEQQVYDDLYSQARAAGQTVEGARGPVSVLTSFYRTMADRLGDDALELYRRLPLRIQGPGRPGGSSGDQYPTAIKSNDQILARLNLNAPSDGGDKLKVVVRPKEASGLDAQSSEYRQTRRGSINFPAGGPDGAQSVINLFEQADLSTLLHESGHFFLEASDALARDPAAPQQLRDDMAVVREYLGAEDGQAFTTDQHETFARAFEAYVMEGKAPSLALADVFARARAWLLRIYRSLAGLNVKITPEIRAVFDRMLATDAEIAQARAEQAASPLFADRPAGMSETDWRTYQRLARRSKEQAEAKLLNRTMERVRREKAAWWKAERAEVRKEVEARLNALPQYRLIEALANGRWLNEDGASDAPDLRIDRKALVDQFGPGILAEISRERFGGKRAIYGDAGMTPAAAAEMFGFSGAPDMVQILQNTTKRVEAINAETDRIMLDRYGDPMTDGTIEQEALDAIHNEQQQQKNVAEARQLATHLGRDTRSMTARLYRQRARLMLGRLTVRDATQSARFLAAERRAGKEAERAFAKVARGDAGALSAALMAKEQQILNAALYDLSREAQAEVERVRERMRGFDKKSVREKLEGGYIEQIDDLLDRYDFRRRSPGQVTRTERLRDFVDRMIAEGREAELAIDPRMMDEARREHYSRLPLDEFRGLVDTIDNLDHLGRFKQKLINARRRRDFEASRDRIVAQVVKRGRSQMSGPRSQAAQALREVLNGSKTAHTIAVELDGLQETGAVYDELLADVYEGEKLEAAMRIEMEQKMSAIIGEHYTRKQVAAMKVARNVPGASSRLWTKAEILSVALNTGNEQNFQRLTDQNVTQSERLNREQVDALLSALDENDWRFVQAYWEHIDSYAPQLAEVHKRRTGVEMKKVEGKQMAAAPAFVRGGYYPIQYDPTKSARAMVDQASLWDRVMSSGRGGKPEVNIGRTMERQQTGGGRALRFDLGVGIEGMRETIRIITLSEAVDNSGRLLRDGEVKQTFLDRQLGHEWTMLDLTLQDVASGPIFHNFWGEKAARVIKNNISSMFLGLNLKTTLLQATGAAQSAAVIGNRNLARGYLEYMRHRGDLLQRIKGVSSFMAEREKTVNKDFADMMADPANTNPVRGRLAMTISTAKQIGYVPIQKMQYYSVDVPTWAGAYLSQIEAGRTEVEAVTYADLMVDRSQGGSFMSSRSAWARGTVSSELRQSAMIRIFTTLAGYMITKLNRGIIETERGIKGVRDGATVTDKVSSAANMALNLTLLYVVEGLVMGLMWAMLDDDDEPEDLLKYTLEETGMSMVGGFPIIRDAFGFAMEGRGAGGMQETIGAIPGRFWQQMVQGENDRAFRRSVADGVGAVTGLPTTSTMRMIEGLIGDDDVSWAEMFLGKSPLPK